MRNFAFDLFGAKKIDFEFSANEDVSRLRLPMDVRKNLYLIFKEAANNIAKYAEADKASFSIQEAGGKLTMSIWDNGQGFDPASATDGNGMANMKARAKEINARLDIWSAPGKGTRIDLHLML
jgi:signal transduction histidine kinase